MKKIILDCDPGMDDSVAIIMAAKSPALDLLAITTVNGNYPVDVTSENARKIMELLGRSDIPVGRGMSRPIARKPAPDPFTHGEDGMANANLPAPKLPLDSRHAVDMIIELVKQHPGEVTLVATGPLSNVAMAMLKCPEIVPMIPQVIAISGMFGLNRYAFENATGDTPQSEWNVYVDPEATKVVHESGVPFLSLGLDVATHFDVDFTDEDLALLQNSPRAEAAFLLRAIQFTRGRGFGAYTAVIDGMAVAVAAQPALAKTFKGHVGIELKDGLTMGMTVLDRRHHFVWQQLPEIEIAEEADYAGVLRMIMELVLA